MLSSSTEFVDLGEQANELEGGVHIEQLTRVGLLVGGGSALHDSINQTREGTAVAMIAVVSLGGVTLERYFFRKNRRGSMFTRKKGWLSSLKDLDFLFEGVPEKDGN